MTAEDGTIVQLEETVMEKDLGVVVDNKLTFSQHINSTVVKANQGRFRWLPRGDSLGSEKHASLENTLVRFKPDTKKCHNIFCQFLTTVHVLWLK